MTRLHSILVALLVSMPVTYAAEPYRNLSSEEASVLSVQAKRFQRALDKGYPETVISMTHPAIFRLGITREHWEREVRKTVRNVAMVTKMERFQWNTISPVYLSDTDEVCFISRTYVVHIIDRRVHIMDYLIAARDVGTSEWFFINASSVGENPKLIWVLFRDLPKDLNLPVHKITRVQ